MNTTFTLDYATWRCGSNGPNQLGEGSTRLLNEEGSMCCLGQFSMQLGATKEEIYNRMSPWSVRKNLGPLTMGEDNYGNSPLSERAMVINDGEYTSPKEKIERLKELFGEWGITINVINAPE